MVDLHLSFWLLLTLINNCCWYITNIFSKAAEIVCRRILRESRLCCGCTQTARMLLWWPLTYIIIILTLVVVSAHSAARRGSGLRRSVQLSPPALAHGAAARRRVSDRPTPFSSPAHRGAGNRRDGRRAVTFRCLSGSDETGQARGASECSNDGLLCPLRGLKLRCNECRKRLFSFSCELGEGGGVAGRLNSALPGGDRCS